MCTRVILWSILLSSTLLMGCIPGPRPLTPPVAGIVLDEDTERVLPDVNISFVEHPKIHTKTDSEGRFYLKKVQYLGVITIGDPIPPSGTIQATKEGYISETLEVFGDWRHESIWHSRKDAINVNIELSRNMQNSDEP